MDRKTFESLADFCNKCINLVKNVFWIFSTVSILFGAIFKVLFKVKGFKDFLDNNFPLFINVVVVWLTQFWAIIGFVFFLLLSIKLLLALKEAKRNNNRYLEQLINDLHKEFVHEIRTQIVQLREITHEVLKLNINEKDGKEKYNHLLTTEYDKLQKNILPYINLISQYISKFRSEKISVCIKIFAFEPEHTKLEERHLITLARCKNTSSKRKNTKDSPVVGKNSDFLLLCKGISSYFGSSDLKSRHSVGVYESDSSFFVNGEYNSTLVAPIRCVSTKIDDGKIEISPNVIGFICIDSKKKIKEWENVDSLDLQFLNIFTDALYVYLNNFYLCFNIKI